MQDSDDLWGDEIPLTEADLAALDAVEKAHTSTSNTSRTLPVRRSDGPPPKRIKLHHIKSPEPVQRGASDFDDVPDISLGGDGSYNISAQTSRIEPSEPVRRAQERPAQSSTHTFSFVVPKPVSHPVHSAQVVQAARGEQKREASTLRTTSGPAFGSQHQPPTFLATAAHGSRLAATSRQSDTVVARGARPGQDHSARQTHAPPSRSEVAQRSESSYVKTQQTRSQLAKTKSSVELDNDRLRRQLAMLEAQLQDARTNVASKSGEARVIRDRWEQERIDHAAEVARLRVAKESAEETKLRLQKDHKEEIERLRTEFTFKHYEMEASTRRAPMSTRKSLAKQSMATPVRLPNEMRGWADTRRPGTSKQTETPRKPQFGDVDPFVAGHRLLQPSQASARPPRLPGFVNSFTQASPVKRVQRAKDKGKANARDDEVFVAPLSPPSSPPRTSVRLTDPPNQMLEDLNGQPSSPLVRDDDRPLNSAMYTQDDMNTIASSLENTSLQEEYAEVETPDWEATLRRILFGHILLPEQTPTLQSLMRTPLPSSASGDDKEAYSAATSRLLSSVAVEPSSIEWKNRLRNVVQNLSKMIHLLSCNGVVDTLAASFNLLCSTLYTLPSCAEALLTAPSTGMEEPEILLALRDTFQRYFEADSGASQREERIIRLATESLRLFEALAWTAPATYIPSLAVVVRAPKVMPTLLGPKQDEAVVRTATRILAVLSTRPVFFRYILANPYPAPGEQPDVDEDTIKHLDRLYSFLPDPVRKDDLKEAILSFVTSVALAHPDATVTLTKSHILIPSIIAYLTDITNPMWEDDEALMASPSKVDWMLQMMSRLMALLTYLLAAATYNVGYRLHHSPIRRFNSIGHAFAVTMCRFAFAEAPSWLSELQKMKLEQVVDMASRLSELVIDGPEMETAWSTFQEDAEAGLAETEEEREARLLHPEDSD